MIATVHGLNEDQMFDWSAHNGDTVEIVGWVHHDGQTWAIWRDDCGCLEELPSWAVVMEPHDPTAHARRVARVEERSGITLAQLSEAVAGTGGIPNAT